MVLRHAATYVRFDIIRRLMENHFKYSLKVHLFVFNTVDRIRVLMAQNVTDVDDKIIARAAERVISANLISFNRLKSYRLGDRGTYLST